MVKKIEKIELEKKIILEKSLEIVINEGYSNLSMRKIGKSCDFSHAKIYYYFSNKEEIILELVTLGFIELRNATEKSLELIESQKERFSVMMRQLYKFGIENSNYFNLMFGFDTPKTKEQLSIDPKSNVFNSFGTESEKYYQLFEDVTKEYADISDDKGQVIGFFIEVAGIVWLENSRLLSERNYKSDTLFQYTLDRMINFIEAKRAAIV